MMVLQIFPLPKVNRRIITSNKLVYTKFLHNRPNDLRVRIILGNCGRPNQASFQNIGICRVSFFQKK